MTTTSPPTAPPETVSAAGPVASSAPVSVASAGPHVSASPAASIDSAAAPSGSTASSVGGAPRPGRRRRLLAVIGAAVVALALLGIAFGSGFAVGASARGPLAAVVGDAPEGGPGGFGQDGTMPGAPPSGTTPEGIAPDGTTDGTAPDGAVPEGVAPEGETDGATDGTTDGATSGGATARPTEARPGSPASDPGR